ncbi:MAG: DUF2961 domain-containing protein [Phycisphaerae bacterium]|nr:DUF2961 domain-containing protein [Planctomycetia bacterium]MCK6465170.1 DUF2961 domain-containing protein [Phycisphaerae bacterium]MCL4718835.1 DUF2961 domain-containing protein [Phycisphaerae bacterium]NUQ08850.1 DUF2961 domain-containing protein [Phycisphaerae bacterium]
MIRMSLMLAGLGVAIAGSTIEAALSKADGVALRATDGTTLLAVSGAVLAAVDGAPLPAVAGAALAPADLPPSAQDDLGALTRVRPGRSRRVSSAAESPLSNRDNRWIQPGETFTLADLKGPATIRHIWLTFAEAAPGWLAKDGAADPSEVVLRAYWDDGETPAVEAPLGDFFAAGFGVRAVVNSVPVQVQGGDAYNCYWAMPFFKRGRLTVTNESPKPFSALYYHIDYIEEESLPPDTAYFCAQYRQEFPEILGRDYLIADIEGRGHYVGTVMSARARSPEWFGEGDEKFYIDGEERASIWGTGTEDYFLSAWGLEKCSFPYFGVPFLDGDWGDVGTRVCSYRWHIVDPVRFTKSLRVEIEHWGWISADETETGKVEGFVEREDDLATVAFWYQVGQPKRFATLPPASERRFPNLDRIVEGKDLMPTARHSGGTLTLQKGYIWTGEGQLFFVPAEADRGQTDDRSKGAEADPRRSTAAGDSATGYAVAGESAAKPFIEFRFKVETKEYRRLMLRLTHSYDYGTYRVLLNGEPAGGPIDLYSKTIEIHDHSLGDYELPPGEHTIRLECTGRNPQSTDQRLGVDSVRLRQRWLVKRPVVKP